MASLIFEVLSGMNFGASVYYWFNDMTDLKHWLFFLLCSVIMIIYANRYEK